MNKFIFNLFILFLLINELKADNSIYELHRDNFKALYDNKNFKTIKLHKNDLIINEIIIRISKLLYNTNTKSEEEVDKLFNKALILWREKVIPKGFTLELEFKPLILLCQVSSDFYIARNKLYKVLEINNILYKESEKYNLLKFEINALINSINISLELGLKDNANELFIIVKNYVEDYFYDYKGTKTNTSDIIINTKFIESLIDINLSFESNSRDLYIKYKDQIESILNEYKNNYILPFANFNTTKQFFREYNKNTIKYHNYYTNIDFLYKISKLAILNNDSKLYLQSKEKLIEALDSNSKGSKELYSNNHYQHNLYEKEKKNNIVIKSSLNRLPYKFKFIKWVLLAELEFYNRNFNEVDNYLNNAESLHKEINKIYKQLPERFYYLDRLNLFYNKYLLMRAKNYLELNEYNKSITYFTKLKTSYEFYRDSLPKKFKNSFFQGSSKEAYLGIIEARVNIVKKQKTINNINNLLGAISDYNSRDFKELIGLKRIVDNRVSINKIQSLLHNDSKFISYFELNNKLLILDIDSNNFEVNIVNLSVDSKKYLNNISYELRMLSSLNHVALKTISELLFSSIQIRKSIKKIFVLNKSSFSSIPIEALFYNDYFIGNKYEVTYLNRLTIPKKRKYNFNSILAIADPIYETDISKYTSNTVISRKRSFSIGGNFSQLPETRDEVIEISKLFNKSKLLLGENATENNLRNINLTSFDVIHFATHGILGNEIPDKNQPALVLGKSLDNNLLLDSSEISKMDLNSNLVVLSACNTGNGKYLNGEGLNGISRSFMIAGVNLVVGTLWQVDSIATKKFMILFYKNLKSGMDPSYALKKAKQDIVELTETTSNSRALKKKNKNLINFGKSTYSHPFYWSPFVLYVN